MSSPPACRDHRGRRPRTGLRRTRSRPRCRRPTRRPRRPRCRTRRGVALLALARRASGLTARIPGPSRSRARRDPARSLPVPCACARRTPRTSRRNVGRSAHAGPRPSPDLRRNRCRPSRRARPPSRWTPRHRRRSSRRKRSSKPFRPHRRRSGQRTRWRWDPRRARPAHRQVRRTAAAVRRSGPKTDPCRPAAPIAQPAPIARPDRIAPLDRADPRSACPPTRSGCPAPALGASPVSPEDSAGGCGAALGRRPRRRADRCRPGPATRSSTVSRLLLEPPGLPPLEDGLPDDPRAGRLGWCFPGRALGYPRTRGCRTIRGCPSNPRTATSPAAEASRASRRTRIRWSWRSPTAPRRQPGPLPSTTTTAAARHLERTPPR